MDVSLALLRIFGNRGDIFMYWIYIYISLDHTNLYGRTLNSKVKGPENLVKEIFTIDEFQELKIQSWKIDTVRRKIISECRFILI